MENGRNRSRLVLYLDTKLTADTGRLISLSLVGLNGTWFYAELVDLPRSSFEELAKRHKLLKVAGTSFAKTHTVASVTQQWLAGQAQQMGRDIGKLDLEIRTSDLAAKEVLTPVLQSRGHLCCASLTMQSRQSDQADLAEYFAACGGTLRVSQHSLIDAMGLAICDQNRTESLEPYDIFNFERLMGAKNAMSFRAWLRRHEQARVQGVNASVARLDLDPAGAAI